MSSLPKGLVHRGGNAATINPFEDLSARQKRPKQLIHNRPISKPKTTKHTLESLQRRQTTLRSTIKSTSKSNSFVDRRIGQYDPTMSRDDVMLARLVRERSKQSKRSMKFQLNDDDDNGGSGALGARSSGGGGSFLTHKGKTLDPNKSNDEVYLSSDDEDPANRGDLEAVDTELHFGGGRMSQRTLSSSTSAYGAYGGADGGGDQYGNSANADLSSIYSHRKTELDELIARKKLQKAERVQQKEKQIDTIEKMDDAFGEISQLLQFRKNQPPPPRDQPKPEPTQEEIEMHDWQREMKQLMMKPKRKATDRTKTPEEIAKEESERLHELETKRMARMNGDFLSDDDLSDISSADENDISSKSKKKKKLRKQIKKQKEKSDRANRNPDELSDSDDDSDDGKDKLEARFTADGLVYVDKDGRVVKKLGEEVEADVDDSSDEEESGNDSDDSSDEDGDDNNGGKGSSKALAVGTRIRGNYRAAEQFDGHETWYDGVVTKVHEKTKKGTKTLLYDVEYDDGDFEENMIRENLRIVEKTPEEKKATKELAATEQTMQRKRQKAKRKARCVAELTKIFVYGVFSRT